MREIAKWYRKRWNRGRVGGGKEAYIKIKTGVIFLCFDSGSTEFVGAKSDGYQPRYQWGSGVKQNLLDINDQNLRERERGRDGRNEKH